jgi:putative DNA primase/helicase
VSACAKFESYIDFLPACTLVLAANDAPRARVDDDGFWGRMQRVPITHVVPEAGRIKNFLEVLRAPEQSEAILAWAVEGCKLWQQSGIGTSAAVSASKEEYRDDNDWLGGFLELYVAEEASVIDAKNFRDQYVRYCEQEGQRPEPTKTLARKIATRMPGVRYKIVRGKRMWDGIRFRDSIPEQPSLPGVSDPDMPPEERFA